MSIQVLRPGLLTTIQDLGRYGFQKFGVVVGGAMDPYALRIANTLVGNDDNEGCLEVTLFGTSLKFTENTLISITGADLQATIDNKQVQMWRPFIAKKGSILSFQSALSGSRAYVAFAGGIDVPKVMDSKSTYIRAQIGGFLGRAIHKGDQLQTGDMTKSNRRIFNQLLLQAASWMVNPNDWLPKDQPHTIRVLPGSDTSHFNTASLHTFFNEAYTITTEADRMGYRLTGTPLTLTTPLEKLSEGVTFGTIQVPPNGQPIVLMADRQTTGGYPIIAQVISADLAKLAQLQALETVHFQEVTIAEAERALIRKEDQLQLIQRAIQLKNLK